MKIKSISIVAFVISTGFVNFNVHSQNGEPIITCSHYAEHLDTKNKPTGETHLYNLGIVQSPQQCQNLVNTDDLVRNYSHICESRVSSQGFGSGPFN